MRNLIGVLMLMAASVFLGWSWGSHKRSEEELNTYHYPALYSAMIIVVDIETNKPIDFEIRWLEGEPSSPKDDEPTKVTDLSDKSKIIALTRRWDRKRYSFQVAASGYQSETVTLAPIWGHTRATFPEGNILIRLGKPDDMKTPNNPGAESGRGVGF